ncbi:MAG: prepilin-type N-terminal cleavage/methylation domain-containing protein, partial [Candidatus Omnitrophica bacterium]|nr:prepilin-type N-terminal cleavage/methylation domain-containing protein [Candidatus Omnitrophota bacterium]
MWRNRGWIMRKHEVNSRSGFSLVELQVALIISAILILAVAGISHISGVTYNK